MKIKVKCTECFSEMAIDLPQDFEMQMRERLEGDLAKERGGIEKSRRDLNESLDNQLDSERERMIIATHKQIQHEIRAHETQFINLNTTLQRAKQKERDLIRRERDLRTKLDDEKREAERTFAAERTKIEEAVRARMHQISTLHEKVHDLQRIAEQQAQQICTNNLSGGFMHERI